MSRKSLFTKNNHEYPEKTWRVLPKSYYKRSTISRRVSELKIISNHSQRQLGITKILFFYFSIPPFLYSCGCTSCKYGLAHKRGWKRIMDLEKPFGYSYDTAWMLDKKLHAGLTEGTNLSNRPLQERTVQNSRRYVFKWVFRPIWNRKCIQRIEQPLQKKSKFRKSCGYYITLPSRHDMIQNHLHKVLAVVAMEPPAVFRFILYATKP